MTRPYIIEAEHIPDLRLEFPEAARFWDHVERLTATPCGCNACSSGQACGRGADYRSPDCEAARP